MDIKRKFCNLKADPSKKLSRELADKVSDYFNKHKDELMYEVVKAKFEQNADCRDELLSTGMDYIVEDTTGWCDNYWGRCSCSNCAGKDARNQLGITLMRVRSELREVNK